MSNNIKIKCPICSGDDNETILSLSKNMKIMGDFFSDTPSKTVCCKKCGCVYVDLNATQEIFSQYYNSSYARTISYYKNFGIEETKEYFGNMYSMFKKNINKNSSILDIGSGVGEFSKYLLDLGYENVISIDPSSYCVEESKKIGVTTLQLDAFTMKNKLKQKFDLIIFGHVIEHILDFKIALTNAKSMLKEDGVLYIEVPDAKRYSDVDFPSYFFFTYEHLSHFTKETFENIANIYGLEFLNTKEYLKARKYYVLGGLFKNDNCCEKINYTPKSKEAIVKYIKYSKNKLQNIISQFKRTQEELILWGIGASTAQLLTETFNGCNIIFLVDSNPARQGLKFEIDRKIFYIVPPENIDNKTATIVVLPVIYKDSIVSQIRKMGFANKIVALKQ